MRTMEMNMPRSRLAVPVQVSDDGAIVVLTDSEPWDLHSNPDGTGGQSKSFPNSSIGRSELETPQLRRELIAQLRRGGEGGVGIGCGAPPPPPPPPHVMFGERRHAAAAAATAAATAATEAQIDLSAITAAGERATATAKAAVAEAATATAAPTTAATAKTNAVETERAAAEAAAAAAEETNKRGGGGGSAAEGDKTPPLLSTATSAERAALEALGWTVLTQELTRRGLPHYADYGSTKMLAERCVRVCFRFRSPPARRRLHGRWSFSLCCDGDALLSPPLRPGSRSRTRPTRGPRRRIRRRLRTRQMWRRRRRRRRRRMRTLRFVTNEPVAFLTRQCLFVHH